MDAATLLAVQLASTWSMVGVIWLVQLVQYPLFSRVGRVGFPAFHAGHSAGITWVVGPLMGAELITAAVFALRRPAWVSPVEAWGGLAMVGLLWLSTAFWQVPQHSRLAVGFDADTHRALVAGNWLRTLLWSLRGLLVLAWMRRALLAGVATP